MSEEIIIDSEELLSRIRSAIPKNPYPESVFTMTIDDYVKAVPDKALRSAISGCLGRWAFGTAVEDMTKRLEDMIDDLIQED